MMGARHARSGVLGAVATGPLLLTVGTPTPATVGLWVAGWVAGSVAPDFDTGGSHPARVWGEGTRVAAAVVGRLAGGHRESTHDIVRAPLAVGGVLAGLLVGASWLASVSPWLGVAAWVLVALPFGFALRMAGETRRFRVFRSPLPNLLASLACSAVTLSDPGRLWFAVAVAAGIVFHILGDSVTNEGAPVSLVWVWGERLLRVGNERTRKDWRTRQWGLRAWKVGSPFEAAMGPVMVGLTFVFLALWVFLGWRAGLSTGVGGPVLTGPPIPGAPDIGLPGTPDPAVLFGDLAGWAWDAAERAARRLLG